MTPEAEPVGTVAEEAAKLLSALHTWADSSQDQHDPDPSAPECRWCPLCQLVRHAKETNPEVREHLSQAALSVVLAMKALLEDSGRSSRRATPVEKIDLMED